MLVFYRIENIALIVCPYKLDFTYSFNRRGHKGFEEERKGKPGSSLPTVGKPSDLDLYLFLLAAKITKV
jgi:hypothetical protein